MRSFSAPVVGVCSWSLRPASAADLAEKTRACGTHYLQLHLDPVRENKSGFAEPDTVAALRAAGISIRSAMMTTLGEDYSTLESIRATGGLRPDHTWHANLTAARENAALAQRLGVSLVSFHAGFLPHDPADPLRAVMLDRIRSVADIFSARGIRLALETGQESADTLAALLDQLPQSVCVNFDPANMILYAMGDPVEALRRLAPRVAQLHLKDALPTTTPGTWGAEVPVGSGAVRWDEFFRIYQEAELRCDLMAEREAGENRVADLRTALELARAHVRDETKLRWSVRARGQS